MRRYINKLRGGNSKIAFIPGMTWTLEVPEDISELITQFTNQLVEDGLVEKILGKIVLTMK